MNDKMKLMPKWAMVMAVIALIYGCTTVEKKQEEPVEELGLKDYYSDYFTMGVAVGGWSFRDSSAALIKQQYGSMTPENAMKMGPIHPAKDTFNWEFPDKIVEFARANNMKIRGHALCWHRQAPRWFFTDDDGNQVSKEVLYERLEAHITAVVTRYKDDVYAWDVVNEAISDSPDEVFRKSKFYEIAGEEFIAKAFEFARAADPNAVLFYNDYSVVNSVKREKIYTMIKDFKAAGVPIDGVGIQGHWSIYSPSKSTIQATIDKFVDLNIDIQVTELDVSVYKDRNDTLGVSEDGKFLFTEKLEQLQIAKYDTIFQVFRDNKDKLSAVTFWNVSDRYSWLDNFPVRGRKNYPLLFDENFEPKKAYDKVITFEK